MLFLPISLSFFFRDFRAFFMFLPRFLIFLRELVYYNEKLIKKKLIWRVKTIPFCKARRHQYVKLQTT